MTIDDLIERVEGAGEGSRELDYRIKAAIEPFDDYWSIRVAADWSTSIDAAVALAERLGWRVYTWDASIEGRSSWMLKSLDDRPGVDPDTGARMFGPDFASGSGKTPALALVAAILKAKKAEGENG